MTLAVPTLDDLDVTDKVVFLRVDFNVPMNQGVITDDTRIQRALPTIREIMAKAKKTIIASHLGRPKGKFNQADSMLPVASRLSELLDLDVIFIHDVVGQEVQDIIHDADEHAICVLENTRFYAGEHSGSEKFAREMAALADVYVTDAFGAMHRKDASVVALAALLPSCAGRLVEREVAALDQVAGQPKRPFGAVLGGAKVSDKIGILERLAGKVDHLFVGGAMANTFLAALGKPVGLCRIEEDQFDTVHKILAIAQSRERPIHLPVDFVVADRFSQDAEPEIVDTIADDKMALDIGPETLATWRTHLDSCRTLYWNGPVGVAEWESFRLGTSTIAQIFADAAAYTVVGGGDSAAALTQLGLDQSVDHLSTGGGASMALIRDGDLVGLAALRKKS